MEKKLPRIRHKKLFILFSVLIIAGIAFIVKAVSSKDYALAEEGDSFELARPSSGTPLEYSALDNTAIAIWSMKNTESFKSNTKGTVVAKVAFFDYTQELNNTRIVSKDYMYLETVSESSLVHVYEEKYFENGQVVIKNDDNYNTVNNDVFLESYGWLPNEFSAYVLNEGTIKEASMESVDGKYVINLLLDPISSTPRKQKETRKIASAKKYPGYSECKLKVYLDENWNVLQVDTFEVYDIGMPGIGDITCTGEMVEVFEYDAFDIPNQGEFASHIGEVSDEIKDTEKTSIDYLQNVFGPLITGKMNDFDISIDALGNKYEGNINIKLGESIGVNAEIGDLGVYYQNDYLYLKIEDQKYKIPLSELSSEGINTDDLMSQIENATITETDDLLTMKIKIVIGQIVVEANIYANIVEEEYILSSISGKVNVLGKDILLDLKPSTYKIKNTPDSTYQDLSNILWIIDEVKALLKQNVEIALDAAIDEINILGKIIIDGNKMSGEIDIVDYLKANVYLENKEIYVCANNIKIKAKINDLINIFLTKEIDLSKIIPLIKTLKINVIDKDNFDISLNVSSLIDSMEEITLSVKKDNGIAISTIIDKISVNCHIKGTDEAVKKALEGDYIDFVDLEWLIDEVKAFIEGEAYLATLNVEYNGLSAYGEILINKDLTIKGNIEVKYQNTTHLIEVIYDKEFIYLNYGNIHVKLSFTDIPTLVEDINVVVGNVMNLLEKEQAKEISLDTSNLINKIVGYLDDLSLSVSENLLLASINEKEVILQKAEEGIDVFYEDAIEANLKVTAKEEIIVPEYEYIGIDDLELLIEYVDNIIDIADDMKYHLTFDLEVNGYKVYGEAKIISQEEFKLYGKVILVKGDKSYFIEAYIIEDRVYVEFSQTFTIAENPLESNPTQSICFSIGFNELADVANELLGGLGLGNEFIESLINSLSDVVENGGNLLSMLQDKTSSLNMMDILKIDISQLIKQITINEEKVMISLSDEQVISINRIDNRISSLDVNVITDKDNNQKLIAHFNWFENASIEEELPNEYLNLTGIGGLAHSLLNNYKLGEIEINGKINAKLLSGLYSVEIGIDGVIDLSDFSNFKMALHLGVPKKAFATKAETDSYLYILDGYAYLKRVTVENKMTSFLHFEDVYTYEYKKMTTEEFLDTILDNIIWMVNFSDLISNSIKDAVVNDTGGRKLEEILTDFSTSSNKYTVTLNGPALVGSDMFSDILASITTGNYTVNDAIDTYVENIGISTSMLLSIIELNVDLNLVHIGETLNWGLLPDNLAEDVNYN